MKTYWDYEEAERATLTEEQVRVLLDVHLMEKGVLRVEPPALKEVKPLPDLKRVTVYVVHGLRNQLAFSTRSQAEQFVALNPMTVGYEWEWGSKLEYCKPVEQSLVKEEQRYDYHDLFSKQAIIRENKAAEEANEKSQREYQEAAKKMNAVLNQVWEDWHTMMSTDREHRKLAATFEEYKRMTGGDEELAAEFLRKIFSVTQILEANTWLKITIPHKPAPQAASAEAKQAAGVPS